MSVDEIVAKIRANNPHFQPGYVEDEEEEANWFCGGKFNT